MECLPSEVNWFDLYEPEANCLSEERFGSGSPRRYEAFGDGPKFICGVDMIASRQKDCLVYSVGSNNKIDFKRSVQQFMGCEIHTFDPTLTKPFTGDEYATFHPWGIGKNGKAGSFRNKQWTAKGLHATMKELGHLNMTIDVLKIDCEQCEYEVLPAFLPLVARDEINVDQILIELPIHGHTDSRKVRNVFDHVDQANYRIFHKVSLYRLYSTVFSLSNRLPLYFEQDWGCQGFKCVKYSLATEKIIRNANAWAICGENHGIISVGGESKIALALEEEIEPDSYSHKPNIEPIAKPSLPLATLANEPRAETSSEPDSPNQSAAHSYPFSFKDFGPANRCDEWPHAETKQSSDA